MWRFDLIPDEVLPEVYGAIQTQNWLLTANYFKKYRVTTSVTNCGSCIDWGEFVLWCEYAIENNFITKDPTNRKNQ